MDVTMQAHVTQRQGSVLAKVLDIIIMIVHKLESQEVSVNSTSNIITNSHTSGYTNHENIYGICITHNYDSFNTLTVSDIISIKIYPSCTSRIAQLII